VGADNWSTDADDREAGLCARCVHMRRIENDRESRFYLCEYAKTDPAYPRYPALPVLRCPAFSRRS